MQHELVPHPDLPAPADTRVGVFAARTGAVLRLRYVLTSPPGLVLLAPPAAPERVDELWRETCFEAFVAVDGVPGYCELNMAPSTQWAAYSFAHYRGGMTNLDLPARPTIDVTRAAGMLAAEVSVDLGNFHPDMASGDWSLGLTAVISCAGDERSYWALAHPAPKPDFHHAGGFTARLPA